MRDARHQRIDIAADAIEVRHLAGDPCRREPLLRAREMDEALARESRMAVAQYLAEIGNLTHFPQQTDRAGMNGQRGDLLVCGQAPAKRGDHQLHALGRDLEPRAAGQGSRAMLQPIRSATACCANSAASADRTGGISTASTISGSSDLCSAVVPKVPSLICRPARPAICAISAAIESAGTPAVKFVDPGKGDMVEIHVEPHSDRVRGNEIIDLAGLKHADLRVACTGAQRPEDDRECRRAGGGSPRQGKTRLPR